MGKLLKPTLVAIFLVLPDNAGKPVDESGVPFGNGFLPLPAMMRQPASRFTAT